MLNEYDIKEFNFTYPYTEVPVLDNINLSIKQGEFFVICGYSGCGKTTLLKHLKSVFELNGDKSGQIFFQGRDISDISSEEQIKKIGFVLQNVEAQIVTDKVWHELAFGLEGLGYDDNLIRKRVAEMSEFFGLYNVMGKKTDELSGGEKQLLNLASVMITNPSVLILDEPASQLDPIARTEFFSCISKINREFGTTIIVAEHDLEEIIGLCTRAAVMDKGKIICVGTPYEVGEYLNEIEHGMLDALPVPMRVYETLKDNSEGNNICPITVGQGKRWLENYCSKNGINKNADIKLNVTDEVNSNRNTIIELDEVWFKYENNTNDVLKGMSLKIREGEIFSILGGNGTGKTTALSIIAGNYIPYRGKVKIGYNHKKNLNNKKNINIGMIPQMPELMFSQKTVKAELSEVINQHTDISFDEVINLCQLDGCMDRHPFDLSGGEKQKLALAKILLLNSSIVLMDEPSKGMDAQFKKVFGKILRKMQKKGITIVLVSHDVEFCAEYSDRCAMVFDGSIVSMDVAKSFFAGNSFYTTAANRMARNIFPMAVTYDDIIRECTGIQDDSSKDTEDDSENNRNIRDNGIYIKKTDKHHLFDVGKLIRIILMLSIPFTLILGDWILNNRKYYFISLLLLLEIIAIFFLSFENRKAQIREVVAIATMSAMAVAGRMAFFMLPNFKPVLAIVIISGIAFGAESGFMVGALSMLVSNIMFGQGPWTPWQMVAMGIIGFISGKVFAGKTGTRRKTDICIFGIVAAIIIYGGIMNPASVIMWQGKLNIKMVMAAYAAGIPFDIMHAIATFIFLWLGAMPLLDKLNRVKQKYGLMC